MTMHLHRDMRTKRTNCGLAIDKVPTHKVAHHRHANIFVDVCNECLNRNALYDLASVNLEDSVVTQDFWDPNLCKVFSAYVDSQGSPLPYTRI